MHPFTHTIELATCPCAVFHAGPSVQMNWFNVDGTGSQTAAGTRAGGSDQMNGDAVMYDSGKILTVGGAQSLPPAFELLPLAWLVGAGGGCVCADPSAECEEEQ